VIEFRHNSWYCDEVSSLLERHNVAVSLHDMAGAELEVSAIGSFRYLRLHGASAKYAGGLLVITNHHAGVGSVEIRILFQLRDFGLMIAWRGSATLFDCASDFSSWFACI
jgi:hypothetical protein